MLDEAIRILKTMGTPDFRGSREEVMKARQLGIEALERLRDNRNGSIMNHTALPSETEN